MGPKQVILIQIRVDLELMAMKNYSTFDRAPGLERHHQMHFNVISRTLVGFIGVFTLGSARSGMHASDRMCSGYGCVDGRSRCALTGILRLRGSSHQALNLLGEVRLIAWRLRPPSLGECRRGPRHFWKHLKKALCHTRTIGGTYDKYQLILQPEPMDINIFVIIIIIIMLYW